MTIWAEYIHSDPNILAGKPVVKGTRLSVEFLLRLFAAGWTEPQVLENYPGLSSESLRAVFAYAADTARDDELFFSGKGRIDAILSQRELSANERWAVACGRSFGCGNCGRLAGNLRQRLLPSPDFR